MKSEASGSTYIISRAVEEPLEATFELGENIKDISSKASRPVILGLLGLALFVLFLVPSVYDSAYELLRGLR
ncbi:MAG: hypothetical protein JSW28_05030, partial [Thermoplasmata archaeon]